MSVYSLVFAGSTPIGNFFAGTTAGTLGVSKAFVISGVITLVSVLILALTFRSKDKIKS